MDAVNLQKVKALKKEVAALCSALRTAYALYKDKQGKVSEYAQNTLVKAQGATLAGKGIIKSVQRGSLQGAECEATITINAVDVAKSFVEGSFTTYDSKTKTAVRSNACPVILTDSTTLTTEVNVEKTGGLNWQVIEFY